ncbi:MAG: ribose 5-phosphate isomerase B [Patescibacteria group bacterium]
MKEKIVVLGADHNGVAQKAVVKKFLIDQGYFPIDMGPHSESQKVDYVDYARAVAHAIHSGEAPRGILICGTGVGMSIVANRFENVRASLVHSIDVAEKTREHNDSNLLCLGSWVNPEEVNLNIIDKWLKTPYGEGRHVRRVEKTKAHDTEKIIFTNGIFDVMHKGHLELLRFCKSLGGKLVVGINSDRATKTLKGPKRPVNSELERKNALEHLDCVDEVVIFDETNTKEVIARIEPDVVVKGGEWTAEEVRKRDEIPDHIEVKVYPIVMQASGVKYSTTDLIGRMENDGEKGT